MNDAHGFHLSLLNNFSSIHNKLRYHGSRVDNIWTIRTTNLETSLYRKKQMKDSVKSTKTFRAAMKTVRDLLI